jgi:NADH-quinone oxidoreductase subunit N
MNTFESLKYFLPETFLLIGAFVILLFDLLSQNKKALGLLSLFVLAGTALLCQSPAIASPLFFGFFTLDHFTHFFRLAAIGMVAITILISLAYKRMPDTYQGEYYSLFLFMTFGLILMAGASNLIMIFLSIEFVSILSYLLVGFLKKSPESKEAAMKYFLFGSVASGVMLYGMSLLFGASGSLEFDFIRKSLVANSYGLITTLSLLFFFVGLGFKISMAPFHMWAPDAYEASPTPVSAFLTVAPKALGFAVWIRVLSGIYPDFLNQWQPLLIFLSMLTMTLGNFIAISQVNMKRLLAYSSVAQAGYILMGLAVFSSNGQIAVLVYLMAYSITNLGAFSVVIAALNHFGNDDLQSYAGLAKRSPFLAACFTLFLLSLAGLPPLAGFIGKFYVFLSALESHFYILALVAVLNSAVAAFYYFKVVRMMYLTPALNETRIHSPWSIKIALWILLVGVFAVGFFPGPVIELVKSSLPT